MLKNIAVAALQNRPWLYSHQHEGASPGRIVELDPSGKINGYNGEQEAHWVIDDGALWFINVHGQRSLRFDVSYRSMGKLVIEGEFIQPGFEGTLVRLDEGRGIERISTLAARDFASKASIPFEKTWVPYRRADYGDTSLNGDGYQAPAFHLYTLNDVRAISKFGAILKDGRLLAESSFQHPFYLCHRLAEDKRGNYLHQSYGSTAAVDHALYACGGMYSNYYHWLMFLMTKIRPEFLGSNDTVIISEPTTEFQKTGLAAILHALKLRAVFLKDNADISVNELAFPFQHGTTGVDPHPGVAQTFSMLKNALLDESLGSGQPIYISRSDTRERRLVNEPEIEALLRDKGVLTISLTGKTLQEQISIFHKATIVIGPHGAGMTNVGFCRPGTRILELQSPQHINWCMKKIAALSGLEYGYIMGEALNAGSQDYYMDLESLKKAIPVLLS